jgi:molybdate transport system substrate-binding protein
MRKIGAALAGTLLIRTRSNSAAAATRQQSKLFIIALLAVVFLAANTITARAADIAFLCAGALQSSVQELIPEFEKATGHRVMPAFGAIGAIALRVQTGAVADLAIVSSQQWDELARESKLDPSVRVVIAKVGVGVFVRKGTAKPDISSAEAFKRAMLNARSVALADPFAGGPVGAYAIHLFEQLGIGWDVRPKLKLVGGGAAPTAPVVRGEAEIGLTTISEILAAPGLDMVGPLPPSIQYFVAYTTAVPATAKQPAAAKALIEFLNTPKAISIFKSKGLEQG